MLTNSFKQYLFDETNRKFNDYKFNENYNEYLIDKYLFINNCDKYNSFTKFINEGPQLLKKKIKIYLIKNSEIIDIHNPFYIDKYEDLLMIYNYYLYCIERDEKNLSLLEILSLVKKYEHIIDLEKCDIYY
jgi:hypothetical protein